MQHDLVATNTLHVGPPETQIAYKYPGQPTYEPPWEENLYAQIDFILTKYRHKNHLSEVKPRPELNYDSDHLPLGAKINTTWYFGKTPEPPKSTRHNRQIDQDTKNRYNEHLRTGNFNWNTIRQEIAEAAVAIRGTRPPELRKPYLKNSTIELLHQRDEAIRRQSHEQTKILTAQFRRQVKKDKKEHLIERLRTFTGHQQNWPAIKNLRRPYVPRFTKRGNTLGSIPANFPNDCATYFATVHWQPKPKQLTASPPPLYPEAFDPGPFTIAELDTAIDTLKSNKAGGTGRDHHGTAERPGQTKQRTPLRTVQRNLCHRKYFRITSMKHW